MSGPSSFGKEIQKKSEKKIFFSGGALPLPILRGVGAKIVPPIFFVGMSSCFQQAIARCCTTFGYFANPTNPFFAQNQLLLPLSPPLNKGCWAFQFQNCQGLNSLIIANHY